MLKYKLVWFNTLNKSGNEFARLQFDKEQNVEKLLVI